MKSGVIVAFEVIGEALANCQFVQLLSAVWNAVKTIGSGIVKILGELGSSLAKNLGEANFSGIIDLLNGISFGAIAVGITKFVGTFRKAIEDIGSFKNSDKGFLDLSQCRIGGIIPGQKICLFPLLLSQVGPPDAA